MVVYPTPNSPVPTNSSPSCDQDTLFLFANSPIGANYTYLWSGPNGFVSTLENPILFGVNNSNQGFYNLSITDTNGCSSQGSVQVVINNKPQTPSFSVSQTTVCVEITLL